MFIVYLIANQIKSKVYKAETAVYKFRIAKRGDLCSELEPRLYHIQECRRNTELD